MQTGALILVGLLLIPFVSSQWFDNLKKCCSLISDNTNTPDCGKEKSCKGEYCVNWALQLKGVPINIFGCMHRLPTGIPKPDEGKTKCNGDKLCACKNSGGDNFLGRLCNENALTQHSPAWPDIRCPGCQHGNHMDEKCGKQESDYCQRKYHPCLWHGPIHYNSTDTSKIWMDCDVKFDLINTAGLYVSPQSWSDGKTVCLSHQGERENEQLCLCKSTNFKCFKGGDASWTPPKYPSLPVIRCYDGFDTTKTMCWGHYCVRTWQTKTCLNVTDTLLFGLPVAPKRKSKNCVEVKGREDEPIWSSCVCNDGNFCSEDCCERWAPVPPLPTTSPIPSGNVTWPQDGVKGLAPGILLGAAASSLVTLFTLVRV